MKKDTHPKNYRPVVFQDLNNGTTFITRSTVATAETVTWQDGKDYPLVKVHISSSSHPYFTGEERIVDIEGRVDRFKARQKAATQAHEAKATSKPKSPRKNAANRPAAQKIGSTKMIKPQDRRPAGKLGATADARPAVESKK